MDSGDIRETEPLNEARIVQDKKLTCCQRFGQFLSNITVEPVAFLALFSNILSSVATQTLGLEKTCRVSLGLDDKICDSLRAQNQSNNFTVYERMVQEYYSNQLLWKSALQALLPLIMLLFVGGWSDATGKRKSIMMVVLSGEIMQCLSNIINVIFFYEIPLQVLLFFDVFFVSIVGGSSVMFLALFNYICDITTAENRTHRFGLVNLCIFAGMPMGLALSGIMLKHLGYFAIYGSSLTLHALNFLYVLLRLSDQARSEEQKQHDGRGVCYFLKLFFNPRTIKETFKVLFKKTENNRTTQLCVIIITVTFLYGPFYGEASIMYMSTRYRFNWNEVDFSIFQTYNFGLNILGTIISILLFSKYLKWHDSVLGIISSISKIGSSFVYCFAATAAIFYIGPVVDLLNGTSILAIKSLYSKLLDPNEIGK
ncbi:hypothetical protein O3G_MSEX014745 [Manduca sexta]|nr:hypothetical protein O3G_MSEX014745 [Manduca sexta]